MISQDRRTFYTDEDNWTAVVGDMYDVQGKLWRLQYGYPGKFQNKVDMPPNYFTSEGMARGGVR